MNAAGNGGGEGAAPLALRTPPRSPNRGGSPSGGDGRSRSPASYSSRLSPRHRSLPRRMARAAGKKMRSLSPCHRPRSEQEAPASAPRPGAARELLSRSSTPEEDLAERLELAATAAEMRRRVRPRTLLHKGLIRANVFLAFEAVDWLVAERHAADRAGAVALGERMRVAGLIAHSRRPDKRFADADLAFAFTRSPRSPAGASAGGSTASSHPSSASASASGTPEGRRKSAEPAVVAAEPPLASGPDPARLRRLTLSVRHLHRRSLAAERSCAWWRVTAAVFFAVTVVQAGGWQYGPAAFSVVGIAAYSMAHTEAVDGSEAEFSGPGDGGGVVLESIDDYADMFREEDAPAAPPGSLERRPSSKQEYEAYVLNRVARLRGGLQEEFPDLDTENAYKDEYLATVLAQPDRRNQTQPRSVSYAMDKLKKAIRWRRGVTLPGPADVQKQMKTGSLYWYGYDNYGRPILWAHPSRKNYNEYDAQAELKMHTLMIEYGIEHYLSRKGTTFCVCPSTRNMGFSAVRPGLMRDLMKLITENYPDRLGVLYAGPVNSALKFFYGVMAATMPANLLRKVKLCVDPKEDLKEILKISEVPDFHGGSKVHSEIFDENGEFSFEKMHQYMMKNKPSS